VPLRFEALYDGVIADPHRKTFAGMVSALDEAVANITHTLDKEGLWQDTLFLFNSDNGGPLGSANNYPLR
jgi:arylsulfatase A-like enzyme